MTERAAGEPMLTDVQHQYPAWTCWHAHGWYHARRSAPPPGSQQEVRGEDPLDLRDEIRRAEAHSQQ